MTAAHLDRVRELIDRARRVVVLTGAGISLVIVNAQPTQFDGIADATLRQGISDVFPSLFGECAAEAR